MTICTSPPQCGKFTIPVTYTTTSRPRAFSRCGLTRPSGENGSSMRLGGDRLDQTVERPTASTIHASQKDATEPRWFARVLANLFGRALSYPADAHRFELMGRVE